MTNRLTRLRNRTRASTTAPLIESQKIVEQSDLFPMLFDGLNTGDGLTVFDTGIAAPETVDFFSQFKCRLIFADLIPELWSATEDANTHNNGDHKGDSEESQVDFKKLLNYPQDTRFDICLFWDFLNHLDIKMLRSFNLALAPFIHDDTRAHCFGRFDKRTPVASQAFGIRTVDQLVVRNTPAHLPPYYPRGYADLRDVLGCFRFSRSMLQSDGRLEILMYAS